MVLITVLLAYEVWLEGGEFIIENPAFVGAQGAAWRWAAKAHHGSLWLLDVVSALMEITGAEFITFPQCALGAPVQKFTTLLCSPGAAAQLRHLASLRCTHYHEGHAQLAKGFDALGRSRSKLAAAYPAPMASAIGRVLATLPMQAPRSRPPHPLLDAVPTRPLPVRQLWLYVP